MENIFTDGNFDAEVLKSSAPVFVDFWAPWCGPCRMMGPIVETMATEMAGQNVKIGKLNVDENPNTAGQYNVMSIPTFILFKGGQAVDQVVGGIQKEKLEEMIKKYI
ncbi:MAG: thioredoxin [Candidatus Magasanikbacteria bacterium]|nr:thioredoxin [Candidatus Magasanikbacteria bacterium]